MTVDDLDEIMLDGAMFPPARMVEEVQRMIRNSKTRFGDVCGFAFCQIMLRRVEVKPPDGDPVTAYPSLLWYMVRRSHLYKREWAWAAMRYMFPFLRREQMRTVARYWELHPKTLAHRFQLGEDLHPVADLHLTTSQLSALYRAVRFLHAVTYDGLQAVYADLKHKGLLNVDDRPT